MKGINPPPPPSVNFHTFFFLFDHPLISYKLFIICKYLECGSGDTKLNDECAPGLLITGGLKESNRNVEILNLIENRHCQLKYTLPTNRYAHTQV